MGAIVAMVGAFVLSIIVSIIAYLILIYRTINTILTVAGFFMAAVLVDVSERLIIKSADILDQKYESYALPVLGALFCVSALFLILGFDYGRIALIVSIVFFSLVGLIFGEEPVRFLIGGVYFLLMPIVLKKLAWPIILWKNNQDGWLTCLINTLFLIIISCPALIMVVTEILVFIYGGRSTAESFATYILAPIVYSLIFYANLRRNKVI